MLLKCFARACSVSVFLWQMHHPEIALHLVKADDNPVGSDRKRRVQSMGAGSSVEMLHRKRLARQTVSLPDRAEGPRGRYTHPGWR